MQGEGMPPWIGQLPISLKARYQPWSLFDRLLLENKAGQDCHFPPSYCWEICLIYMGCCMHWRGEIACLYSSSDARKHDCVESSAPDHWQCWSQSTSLLHCRMSLSTQQAWWRSPGKHHGITIAWFTKSDLPISCLAWQGNCQGFYRATTLE